MKKLEKNKILAKQIIEMAQIDQEVRLKTKPGREIGNFLIYIIDILHNYRIRKIIEKYGYPTSRFIGKKAMRSFWILVQHQDLDLELQKTCLENCDFGIQEKAYLTDRILVNSGRKQIYGSQYKIKNKKSILRPIQNRKNIDKRRFEYGLNTIAEQTRKIKKEYSNLLK